MAEINHAHGTQSRNGHPKIGVYVCHCGMNIASRMDISGVVEFAKTLPYVTVSREYKFMCADPGQELIVKDLKDGLIDRVVVASCSPLMHESTFRRATVSGGSNAYLFQMANIREHVSWVTTDDKAATQKAKALVAGAVRRVAWHTPLERNRVQVKPDVVVVGAGISGIHAALTLGDAGKKVHLVERESTIGGHMAMFDKTFPTLDCSACILTPKMNQVRNHPNIALHTYSEVEKVDGYVGNFNVTIRKRARYVHEDLCTGCDQCTHICPVELTSEFDSGLTNRAAIYRAFPQAVPNTFTITRKGTPPCVTACPIHQNAHGYVTLLSEGKWRRAMQLVLRDNPLPSACARLCSRPCETSCTRKDVDESVAIRDLKRAAIDRAKKKVELPKPSEEREETVAIVGAGPAGLTCAYDLRLKGYKPVVYDSCEVAGGSLATTIPAFRLPHETLAAEIERLAQVGIEFRLGVSVGEIVTLDELHSIHAAVFIAVGATTEKPLGIPGEDLIRVWKGASLMQHMREHGGASLGRRVMVVGGGDAAIDAARSALRAGATEVTVLHGTGDRALTADPLEIRQAEAEGVRFLSNLPNAITKSDAGLRVTCQHDGQSNARVFDVEDVIVSVDRRPWLHGVGEPEGLQVSPTGTLEVDPVTLETGRPGMFAGGECVTGPVNVVYAMAAGRKAAVSIDRYINRLEMREGRELEGPYESTVVTKTSGITPELRVATPARSQHDRGTFDEVYGPLEKPAAQAEAKRCLDCAACCDCQLCATVCEPDAIDFTMKDELIEVEAGAVIVSTGFKTFDAKRIARYGYGVYPDVYTALEVERLVNSSGPTEGQIKLKDGRTPKAVGIIHCVGSRDENTNRWCSRVCCMYSLKLAHLVRERTGAEVFNFYIDIRAPGKGYEEFYDKLLKEGVHFIRGRVAEVNDWALTPEEQGRLVIRAEDTLVGAVRRVPVDMVVLAVGLEPQTDAEEMRRRFNISCSQEGWFLERHPKLAPVSTFTDGVFLAGACQGPKDIPDSVAQAGAAAAEALSLIDRQFVELEPNTAIVIEERCSGCKTCIPMCPFSALSHDPHTSKVTLNEALCKGCGTCVAACPSGALQQHLFTDQEIYQEIEGVLSYA